MLVYCYCVILLFDWFVARYHGFEDPHYMFQDHHHHCFVVVVVAAVIQLIVILVHILHSLLN